MSMESAYELIPYSDSLAAAWDTFVSSHSGGRYSHSVAYKQLVERYAHFASAYFAVTTREGAVAAVLPLFAKTGFRAKLTSQPFADYGGMLIGAKHEAKTDEIMKLFAKAIDASLVRFGLNYAELKNPPVAIREGDAFVRRPLYRYAQLALDEPPDVLWKKRVDHSVRKNVNRSEKCGLIVREQSDPESIERWFYPMYVASMRRLASIPHGLDFFMTAKTLFKERFQIWTAWHGDLPVAALVGWVSGDRVVITQIASDDRHLDKRGPDAVHWGFIKWAYASGIRYFDFSVVRYGGQEQYKRKWGCQFFPYHVDYRAKVAGTRLPSPIHDRSAGMKHLRPLWKHLVPTAVTQVVGKPIRVFFGI